MFISMVLQQRAALEELLDQKRRREDEAPNLNSRVPRRSFRAKPGPFAPATPKLLGEGGCFAG
jgi:hypothetical protein